uniref:CDT1 domain-containing protein n=1 Tax=Heterorhabditis bacteriophora TaxID=37862 RepID=A0A1I7WCI7_HETBA
MNSRTRTRSMKNLNIGTFLLSITIINCSLCLHSCISSSEGAFSPPKRSRKVSTSSKSPEKLNSRQSAVVARRIEEQPSSEVHKSSNSTVQCDGPALSSNIVTEDVGSDSVLSKADEWSKLLENSTLAKKEKGGIKSLHDQAIKIKSKQVEEQAKSLKLLQKHFDVSVPIRMKSSVKFSENAISTSVSRNSGWGSSSSNIVVFRRVLEYGKAARLVEDVKRNVDLPLPGAYEKLLETFQSCDRVRQHFYFIMEFHHRLHYFIIHTYPTSYEVRVEKHWQAFGGTQAGKYERIIVANLTDDLTEYMRPDSPVKDETPLPPVTPTKLISPRKRVVSAVPREPVPDNRPRLEGWRMACRSHVFRYKLVGIIKKIHRQFMEKIGSKELFNILMLDCTLFELILNSILIMLYEDDLKKNTEMKDYLDLVDTTVPLPKAVQVFSCSINSEYYFNYSRFFYSYHYIFRMLASSMLRCVCTNCIFLVEVIEHLTLLCEVAPSHIAVSEVLGKKYLQMKDNNFSVMELFYIYYAIAICFNQLFPLKGY